MSAVQKFALGLHRPKSEVGDKLITLVASMAGYTGFTLQSDYASFKLGVRGLFRSLLNDQASATCPVRINLLAPHIVATPHCSHIPPKLQEVGVKLAEIHDVRVAALRLMCDKSIHGRAMGIWEGGPVDSGDELGGDYGSHVVRSKLDEGAMVRSMA